MDKIAKIAIGCVVAAFLGVLVVVVGLGGLAWWGKGKLEKIAQTETKIQEAEKKANAASFTLPGGGVIAEDRLVKFLDVRKRVYAVYEKHQDAIEAMKNKKEGSLSDVTAAFGFINELRQEQAQALADLGMSTDEYRYMVTAVYKTMLAAEVATQADVPQANIDLFRKHETEIKKYAMGGLEFLGL